MALINEKFTLRTEMPLTGGVAGIWMTLNTQEAVDAMAVGAGPGVPDENGTFVGGTILRGFGVTFNSLGNVVKATSVDVTAALPQLLMVVFAGNNDFSGRFSNAKVVVVHGGVRFDTEKFGAGPFTPNVPLTLTAGVWNLSVLGDHKQIAGWVGPRGLANGVLDVIMPQGVAAGG